MVWYDDPAIILIIVLVAIIASGTVIFVMRRNSKPKPQKLQQTQPDQLLMFPHVPFKISKSVQTTMASSARDELRILELEREILGDAIRRLYEAHAEGKITEQERERLAASYKVRMNAIKESIAKDENIIALHELEGMQEDLMKLFSERFGELSSKVEELRSKIDVKPIREVPVKLPVQVQVESEEEEEVEEGEEPAEIMGEEKAKKKRKAVVEKPTQKTEAERRIESIRSEVEKVLDRLGQMEVEG
jgi:hypothetical protein